MNNEWIMSEWMNEWRAKFEQTTVKSCNDNVIK